MKKRSKKVLITGGAGFIGSHLAERLLKEGTEVYIIDDLSTGSIDNIKHLLAHPNFHYKIDTIMDYLLMKDLIDIVDEIYHLAAAVGVKYVIENPLHSLNINVRGTEIILELANKDKKKVFIASTSEVYGKQTQFPLSETSNSVIGNTTISRWGYAASKMLDEFLSLAYFREKKLPIIIGRFFNVCGPRQSASYGMVIPRFVKQALLGNPLTVYGSGKQSRCFGHVSDVINGMIKLMQNEKSIGQIFNIGSDEEITIEDLAKKVKKLTHSESEIEYIPYDKAYEKGFEDMERRVPDLSKIKNFIGYSPQKSLDDIINEVIEYFKE
jgi:UDP-glucose 4-epimerase